MVLMQISCATRRLAAATPSRAIMRMASSNSRSSNHSLARLNPLSPTGTMTKIVCTIGPATDDKIDELIANRMHVARLNFSHAGSDYTYPETCMESVRTTPGKHGNILATGSIDTTVPPNVRAILVDTKGPEIRTGVLQGEQEILEIELGDIIELTTRDVSKDAIPGDAGTRCIQVDYMSIAKSLSPGSQVLLDDGLIALEVTDIEADDSVLCVALNAGPIKKNKGVNLPGVELDLPALTEKDKRDLKWACDVGADYVAASFIRTAANVRSVVAYLDRCIAAQTTGTVEGKKTLRPLVISKIESKEGVDNFDDILTESDGIMVARGDLGVEIPYSKVFKAQKMMVSACNKVGKPVIVATQMLDSMMRNPRPTRAEVTDVGTAVLDGADAVMLSGETAAGKYPIESLKAMASIASEADQILDGKLEMIWNQELHDAMTPSEQDMDAVCASSVKSAMQMRANLIVCITMSGRVARALSRHRPTVPVLAFCTDVQVARRLQLQRGINPIMLQSNLDPGAKGTMGLLRAEAMRTAKELGYAKAGDRIVMVDRNVGKDHDMHEYSHNMKVVTLR